tara:strand:+ start:366 stop:620 length:255 start_codon:yes stop_codon:yes gene_type:complete
MFMLYLILRRIKTFFQLILPKSAKAVEIETHPHPVKKISQGAVDFEKGGVTFEWYPLPSPAYAVISAIADRQTNTISKGNSSII